MENNGRYYATLGVAGGLCIFAGIAYLITRDTATFGLFGASIGGLLATLTGSLHAGPAANTEKGDVNVTKI